LGGCRFHGNIEWAEYAAEAALAINPMSAPIYVMLSNMYLCIHVYTVNQFNELDMLQLGDGRIDRKFELKWNKKESIKFLAGHKLKLLVRPTRS
jgi:hypothetical protein